MELKDLENVKVDRDIKVLRGEVWYVEPIKTDGHEQSGTRPAVIVSNDIGNKNAPIVEIVYVTTQIKAKMPTHAQINNFKMTGIALCESVTTIDKTRLINRVTKLTDQQMSYIDKALCISLEITKKPEVRQQMARTQEPVISVIAIPGENDNYIIKQANEHIKKLVDAGNDLNIVEHELTKIMQADITLGGVSGDYLTEEMKEEIRHKAAENVRTRKTSLENELLSLLGKRKPAIINQNFEDAVQEMVEQAKVSNDNAVEKPMKSDVSDKALQKAEKELDFEAVRKAYLEDGLNMGDLGRKFHKAPATMSAYLKSHGISKPRGVYNRKPR